MAYPAAQLAYIYPGEQGPHQPDPGAGRARRRPQVTDYIGTLTAELGRQPTSEEYSQVMTGFTPEQIPVLSGLARGFGVFDHWFCEVPSQTFTNRSFWTAATASGLVVNQPVSNWLAGNTAETIFNRLEQHGKTWKVYIGEPDRFSATGLIHYPRLKDPRHPPRPPRLARAGPAPGTRYIQDALGLGQTISAIGATVFNFLAIQFPLLHPAVPSPAASP